MVYEWAFLLIRFLYFLCFKTYELFWIFFKQQYEQKEECTKFMQDSALNSINLIKFYWLITLIFFVHHALK